ncbi:MAG: CoA-binding protein [Dehalococcoidia bacterium]|nr:CoA-binding protein [Dehalococcoidia bacterium]
MGTFEELEAIFRPRSIAVVGASANRDSAGYDYVLSLVQYGYRGQIYPVNPRLDELLGWQAYPNLEAVPGPVEYVISCIPNTAVLPLLEECGRKGVKALQLFTARFSETGREEGRRLERELLARAQQIGVRIIGPNCLGLHHPEEGITFRPDMIAPAGGIGFLSQSGNLLFELNYQGRVRGLYFSKAISYGNGLDLDECDFLRYFAHDPQTKVIGAYIEGVKDGRRFLSALREAAQAKPTVLLKGGRTQGGGRAASSHTAALAGSYAVWEAAVRQAGAIPVRSTEELMDLLIAFARLPPARGGRIGVVGGGGGRSVLAADRSEEEGLATPPLTPRIQEHIALKAPELAGWVTNPVDQSILAGSGVGGAEILALMAEDPEYDALIAILGEPWALGRPNAEAILRRVAQRFMAVASHTSKPVAVVVHPADYEEEWQWRLLQEVRREMVAAGMAIFPSVDRAIVALARFMRYWEGRG